MKLILGLFVIVMAIEAGLINRIIKIPKKMARKIGL
jgi:hypothetical protein